MLLQKVKQNEREENLNFDINSNIEWKEEFQEKSYSLKKNENGNYITSESKENLIYFLLSLLSSKQKPIL